jgi:hypothetical protein
MPDRPRFGTALLISVAIVAVAALAAAAIENGGFAGVADDSTPGAVARGHAHRAARAVGLAHPAKPAFSVPTPKPLTLSGGVAMWAPVIRSVAARAHPRRGARIVAQVSTRTPEGTTNILLAIGHRRDPADRLWVHARLPSLTNNVTAWVPRSSLGGYRFVHTHLVVNLHSLDTTLYRGRKMLFHAPVGVGASATPTPLGQFYIRDRLTRYASPFYGPIAFGTSARSPVLTDWPAGGYIGIHGTNHPELIPGRISHGCIRLRNPDIRRLAALMPVGTPVTIEEAR